MHVEMKDKKLIVVIPLEDPIGDSASGKTLLIASSHGNQKTDLLYKGQPVIVGLSAYVRKEKK